MNRQTVVENKNTLNRVAGASFIGNFVEWFDYAAYGFLATVIAVVFFGQRLLSRSMLRRMMSP